jgi:transcriptional regulator, BadM/Rrf2 family
MTLLAKRGSMAVVAVLDIAIHARPEPVAAKALAQRLDLPPRHLEPLLQVLVRGAILRSVRGPRGGYELARERRRITVADILRASLSDPHEGADSLPPLLAAVVGPLAAEVSDKVLAAFDDITVDDLCARALAVTDLGRSGAPADFAI